MNRWKMLLVTCAALLPAAANATVLWRGDFETGDRSQYSRADITAEDRLQVVGDPVTQGQFALKATVVQGDNPNHASGNRNELLELTYDPEGSEYYYSWSTLFPTSYLTTKQWQVFTQWHHPTCCGSPPVQFVTSGDEIQLVLGAHDGSNGTVVWRTALARGAWERFTLHIHWSVDPSKGWVELWYNGQPVLPRTFGYTGAGTYLKQGLYRDEAIGPTEFVFHDGMVKADALADVEPPPTPAEGGGDGSGSGSAGSTSGASAPLVNRPLADGGYGADAAELDGGGCSASGSGGVSALGVLAVALLFIQRQRARVQARVRAQRR